MTAEKQQVLHAICQDRDHRVTVADVANRTGMSLQHASLQLNRIAAECGAVLEVATSGDIVYRFVHNLRGSSIIRRMQRVLLDLRPQAAMILRRSVGVPAVCLLAFTYFWLLVLGYALVPAFLLLLLIVATHIGLVASLVGAVALWFIFTRWPRNTEPVPDALPIFRITEGVLSLIMRGLSLPLFALLSRNESPSEQNSDPKDKKESGLSAFRRECLAFLLGNGDPNADLEARKWQLVSEVIAQNNGAVTAEQLAPYTSADPNDYDSIFPALIRFNGYPEVTERGNIVYVFPELRVTVAEDSEQQMSPYKAVGDSGTSASIPTYLKEQTLKFSDLAASNLRTVTELATGAFLAGWAWFFFAGASPFIWTLVVYSTLLVLLPVLRKLIIDWINPRIEKRNKIRESYGQQVCSGDQAMNSNLADSKQFQIAEHVITQDEIIYRTDRDALEQEIEHLSDPVSSALNREDLSIENMQPERSIDKMIGS
jgi:hypothetical protein